MNRRRKPNLPNPDHQSQPLTPSDYSFSLTKIAVSQICKSVGYKSANSSAIDTLTLITTKFLQSLAGLASSLANTANRTEVNLFDIINSLQDISLSTSDCFPGDSTTSHCLIKSNILKSLSDFVTNYPEIPFAKPLPKPEINGSSLIRSNRSSEVVNKSVPIWLPAFPESSLCVDSCVNERSDKLWENSDSVIGGGEVLTESLKCERSGGSLPKRRGRVRFKVERNRVKNDGVSGCEVESETKKMKLIRGECIYNDGDWPIWRHSGEEENLVLDGFRTRDV